MDTGRTAEESFRSGTCERSEIKDSRHRSSDARLSAQVGYLQEIIRQEGRWLALHLTALEALLQLCYAVPERIHPEAVHGPPANAVIP